MLIYLTGATGFLGQHLRRAFQARGWAVAWHSHAEVNLLSRDLTISAIAQTAPDVVVHAAAACGGIGANMAKPATFWHDNLLMGMNVLEACARAEVGKLVMIGTTCAYPAEAPIPFREETIWDGYPEPTNAPYAIAKRALMVGAEAYWRERGLKTITVIPTNLYGPGDNFDLQTSHVIPALIRKFHAARPSGEVEVWGNGRVSRDFLYVADAAEGIARAIEVKYDYCLPINLGSGREVWIKDVVSLVRDVTGHSGPVTWASSKPNGQWRRVLDTSWAERKLGWTASTTLEDGIRETYRWWRERA